MFYHKIGTVDNVPLFQAVKLLQNFHFHGLTKNKIDDKCQKSIVLAGLWLKIWRKITNNGKV